MMKDEILKNLNHPKNLEALYRDNKEKFKLDFNVLYESISNSLVAQVWHERLNAERDVISWGTTRELFLILITSLLAGCIAKIPDLFSIDPDYFFPRNIGFVIFPLLTLYFSWKQNISYKRIIFIIIAILTSALYINILPDNPKSDTLVLACIHLPLFLWAIMGTSFMGNQIQDDQKRLSFLTFNGDWIVMTTLIMISGAIMTAITIGLFELIQIRIEEVYFKYFGIWGVAAAPIVGTYLVQVNPQLVNKVSPVIAKLFTPLVLTMLVIYLVAIILTGKDPYNDREFLLIFNALLAGVMAIIFFSLTEHLKNKTSFGLWVLLALSAVTVILNSIALSAILFRISSLGITPNRLAVLGSNLLMLINLTVITFRLFKSTRAGYQSGYIEKSLAVFLPIYFIWAMIVIFLFPMLFGFN